MLVDGVEPEAIRHMLEIDLNGQEHQDLAAAKVFEGMGIYAPTLGIIGAVFGLIAVMKNLADPSKLGPRHRRRVHRDDLRHRLGQPVLPAHRHQAQERDRRAAAASAR